MTTYEDAEQIVTGIYSMFKSGALHNGYLTVLPDIQTDMVYAVDGYSNQYGSWLINHETGWTDLHVFAWMPLPEQYEEGDNE